MNVPTITMEPEAAMAKLQAYQIQVKRRFDEEYEVAVIGYRALAHGTPLINLSEVFANTGLGEDDRPLLAIARADRRQVKYRRFRDSLRFNTLLRAEWGYEGSLLIDVPFDFPNSRSSIFCDGYALVPMVPADVRPSGSLKNFFVLWEVEQWSDKPLQAEPDYDPYFLQHLIGDLYAIVAEWELTELERAIMTGRRNG